MEVLKQYFPWIIGAIVVFYIFRRFTTKTSFLPQTQLTQTPQADPYAEARSKAFEVLTGLGIAQIGSDVERARISEASTLERLRIASEEKIGLSAIELQNRLANLNLLQRDQDRQVQQSAIDRYYSSRNTGQIVGSIAQAVGQIFGQRNRNVFGTPPTFPSSFSFGGF